MKTLLFTAILIVANLSFAQSALDGEYTTGYVHPVGTMTVTIEGNMATVMINPNSCIMNAIGNPQICTLIAINEKKGELKLDLETSAQFSRGTSLYRIDGTDLGIVSFKNLQSSWMRIVRFHPENPDTAIFAAPLTAK